MEPILVAGHVCIDLTPELGAPPSIEPGRLFDVGRLHLTPGGCVANTGLTLAALGVPTRLAACVGSDDLGHVLVGLLERAGAETSGIRRVDGSMTSYSIVVEAPGRDRTFWHHVGANARFDGTDVDLDAAAILHVGYATLLPALLEGTARPLRALLGRAKAAKITTSIDLAEIDPRSAAAALPWARLLPEILPGCDVLTPSVDDLRSMLPDRDLDSAGWADLLVGWGVAVALVTAGAEGMTLRTGSRERLQVAGRGLGRRAETWARAALSARPIEVPVASSTGAGDAASAGFLAAIVHGEGPERATRWAAATAAARIAGLRFDRTAELAERVAVE